MGNSQSIKKVSFEDVQMASKSQAKYLIINVLTLDEQACLIEGTVPAINEENVVNRYQQTKKFDINIIVYGKNSSDEQIVKKCNQLTYNGFQNVYVYPGGLFEWLLLQDIYGAEIFSTTTDEVDILKYKAPNLFGILMIGNG